MYICANCEETFDKKQSDAPKPKSFCSWSCQAAFTD